MTDAADYITVGGKFIMHSQYSGNNLSAGVLEIKGDRSKSLLANLVGLPRGGSIYSET